MGLLSRLRRRSKSHSRAGNVATSYDHLCLDSHHTFAALDLTKKLPRPLLARIFTYVCPHTIDSSYDTSEESMTEDGCMLCDMRDLAHCAVVCKRWYLEARALL